ncbi:unnamed protein product [Aureobasidium uvarum]|uniref:Uncharacterized protein n=1 Tax=Aureobasidium uvarum TaxID=2773716 RepID=A0A9N8KZT3_9PEZI|nr:unnamed protein product [Aureobasidium uvarum]
MASTELHPNPFSNQQLQHQEPQRLSGIYQYHNAPEVLPEHGLEYDDNTYPVSDKYPVTSMDDYPASFNAQQYRDNNKPPRIIFGMKVRSFLLVALVFVLIVVGAVVGGTVGRNASHTANAAAVANDSSSSSTTISSSLAGVRTIAASGPTTTAATSATTTTAAASTTVLSTPTFTPLSACPTANNTLFISTISNTSSLLPPTNNTISNLTYTRYCDGNTPADFKPLTSGFVYTFDDCIDLCAAYNVYAADSSTGCNVAVYDVKQARPVNCVVGSTQSANAQSVGIDGGLAVAILTPSI